MKLYYIYGLLALFVLAGCDKSADEENFSPPLQYPEESGQAVPEDCFVVSFSNGLPETRAAVSGSDNRVQHVRYIVYKSTGEFVKTRVILAPGTTAVWPLGVVRDTLPRGSYIAVFLGNVEKSLFPYAIPGSSVNYSEVLQNYTVNYSSARILLPPAEFTSRTEYYLAKANFSDTNPNPSILLQRIIGFENVHRNLVDAQTALNQLVNNIVTQVGYRNILQTTAQGLLTSQIKTVVGQNVSGIVLNALGGIDAVVNPIVEKLVQPVTDALYTLFLQKLVDQIGTALAANENQEGLLGVLGALLNPWESLDAYSAIVSIKDFPKSIDFNLTVQSKYTGVNQFRYDFSSDQFLSQKCLYIKGFSGLFDIQKIHVVKQGLVSGLLWNGVIDNSLILDGVFVDVTDSLSYTPGVNRRYKADYSFLDLGLKSYTQQTDGNHSLSVSVQLGQIANIDGILGGIPILGTILNLVLSPIKNITITTPLNLPLLGVDNLSLTGSWNTPTAY